MGENLDNPIEEGVLSIVDAHPLFALLGDSAPVRILVVLLNNANDPLNKSEIARLADVDRSTVTRLWDHFEKLEIVEQAGERHGAPAWRLNRDVEVYEPLRRLDWGLLAGMARREQKSEGVGDPATSALVDLDRGPPDRAVSNTEDDSGADVDNDSSE